MNKNKRIGKIGELLAVKYLEEQGYSIIQTNFSTIVGEIDIIAKKDTTIFFIEVKTRTSLVFGSGMESITPRKIEKIQKTAEIYITDNGWSGLVQMLFISIYYQSKTRFSIDMVEAH